MHLLGILKYYYMFGMLKHVIIFENSQKTHLNQINFHNLLSHLIYRPTKLCVLIKHIICECLLKIQHFGHEWSPIMYESS